MSSENPSPWEPTRLRRRSEETTVTVAIGGEARGATAELPDPLVAHGIESLAAWADLPLRLRARGDDVHHAVEDAALTLGRAIRRAVGDRPRERVGHAAVPMDDALVEVALDLGGRPYASVDPRLPPLVQHFYRSMAQEAGWTIHVLVRAGQDEHHLVEASFKATGLALARAAAPRRRPVSRKGSVVWETGGRW